MTSEELRALIKRRYPKHRVHVCTNGKVARRAPWTFHTKVGKVKRDVLVAVYDPATFQG